MYIFVQFLLKYINNVVTGKDIQDAETSLDRDFSKMYSRNAVDNMGNIHGSTKIFQ